MTFYFMSSFPLQPGLKNAFNNNAVQISSDISLGFFGQNLKLQKLPVIIKIKLTIYSLAYLDVKLNGISW